MFNVKLILEDKDKVINNLKNRNFSDTSIIDEIISLDSRRKELVVESENTRALQNKMSKEMPVVMKNGTDEEKAKIRTELKELSEKVKSFAPEVKAVEEELNFKLLSIPNLMADDTPLGKDESSNVETSVFGEKPTFDFKPLEHFDIAKDSIDSERGTKLSGARFVVYKKEIARLERALMNYMLDTATENGYCETVPPVLVSRDTMTGSGQLPKFEDDAYKTTDDLFLIPTAEVSLVNLHSNEMMDEEELPKYYVAYTPCFRREAGSYGKDTKGIIRMHQFNKVELVKFVKPEDSMDELNKLLKNAEQVLAGLGLHYRVIELCSGDLGFNAVKTYDIEVWLPGQDQFREISSCSNTGDFQARRANIRFKRKDGGKPEFVHLLNGSGIAIDRTIVAVLENYQNADGSVTVPKALQKYLNNAEALTF
jgi:seryl-tRNA synthetase